MLYLGDTEVKALCRGGLPIYKAYIGDTPLHIGYIPCNYRYHEVEYITLKSRQYFDTGIKQKANTSMFLEYTPSVQNVCNVATEYGKIISQSGGTLELRWFAYHPASANNYQILSPTFGKYTAGDNVWIRAYWNVNGKFWMERNGIMTTADVYVPANGLEPIADISGKNIFLNTGPYNPYPATANYKCFTIWEDNIPVYNVVPCIDTFTGEYGYYDTVSGKFLHESLGNVIKGGPVLENARKFN